MTVTFEETTREETVIEAPDPIDAAFCRIADAVRGGTWAINSQSEGCILGLIGTLGRS